MADKKNKKGNTGKVNLFGGSFGDISTADLNKFKTTISNNTDKLAKKQYGQSVDDLKLGKLTANLLNNIGTRNNSLINMRLNGGDRSGINHYDGMIDIASRYGMKDPSAKTNKKKDEKTKEAIKSEIVKSNQAYAEEVVQSNKAKQHERLATYNLIMRVIPKMRLVLKTYASSIINPDDFTKTSLLPTIDKTKIPQEMEDKVRNNIEQLLEEYALNDNILNDIITYIKDGVIYYTVLSLHKEINRLLNEHGGDVDDQTLYEQFIQEATKGDLGGYIHLGETSTLNLS